MGTLHEEIVKLYARADAGEGLKGMVDGICQAIQSHAGELQGVTYSYRLHATDTGYWKAFSLVDGQYYEKTQADEADTVISGTEQNLLAVLQRKQNPMSALLRGKIKVKGSMAAVLRFVEFL